MFRPGHKKTRLSGGNFVGFGSRSVGVGLNVDKLAPFLAGGEYHYSVDEGEQRVVFAHAYVEAGMMLRATLTFKDIACLAVRSSEYLHSKSFAF